MSSKFSPSRQSTVVPLLAAMVSAWLSCCFVGDNFAFVDPRVQSLYLLICLLVLFANVFYVAQMHRRRRKMLGFAILFAPILITACFFYDSVANPSGRWQDRSLICTKFFEKSKILVFVETTPFSPNVIVFERYDFLGLPLRADRLVKRFTCADVAVWQPGNCNVLEVSNCRHDRQYKSFAEFDKTGKCILIARD